MLNHFVKKYRAADRIFLAALFFLTGLVLLPVILGGIPDGKDLGHHLKFSAIYYEAISAGDLFPGWAASDNHGFGQAGIRFYPPLGYYGLSIARMLAGNWYDAIWINFFIWTFAGAVGFYYWAKEWLSPVWSAAGAILYVLAPYHLSQIYQTWLYAEYVAAGVLPFCFLFAARVCRRGKWIDVLALAVSVSLLTLSHIPTTIIGGLALSVYILFLIKPAELKIAFPKLFAAAVLSLSLSAFHWIKVVSEVDWVQFNTVQYRSGYYDYRNHIFPIFLSGGEFYQARLLWLFDALFILSALFFIPGALYLIFKIRDEKESVYRRPIVAVAATGAFSLFMASAASALLWQNISLLQKLQFPWRWLSVASLAGAMLFVLASSRLLAGESRFKRFGAYLVLSILLSMGLFNLTQNVLPAAPIRRTDFEAKAAVLINETGCPCWFPAWARPQAFNQPEKVSAGERAVRIDRWEAETRAFSVAAGEPTAARAATFYYPFWKAEVNGQDTVVERDENGVILIPLSGAESRIHLIFIEPFVNKIAHWLSLFSWAFFLFLPICLLWRKLLWVRQAK